MKIYDLLEKDHRLQEDLLARLAETSGDTPERRELFARLRSEADAHANAEEQTFYAALLRSPRAQEKARHSISEHADAAKLLEELAELDMGSGGWLGKLKKLKEELEHHVREEEDETFAKARSVLDDEAAERLGREFGQRKEQELAKARKAS